MKYLQKLHFDFDLDFIDFWPHCSVKTVSKVYAINKNLQFHNAVWPNFPKHFFKSHFRWCKTVKIAASVNRKSWKNNIYSMILGSDCRLAADADPSSGFGPAQLLPPPSSLVSLSSTFSFLNFFWLIAQKKNFRDSVFWMHTKKKRKKTFFIAPDDESTVNSGVVPLKSISHQKVLQLARKCWTGHCVSWRLLWRHDTHNLHLTVYFSRKSIGKLFVWMSVWFDWNLNNSQIELLFLFSRQSLSISLFPFRFYIFFSLFV